MERLGRIDYTLDRKEDKDKGLDVVIVNIFYCQNPWIFVQLEILDYISKGAVAFDSGDVAYVQVRRERNLNVAIGWKWVGRTDLKV